MLSSGLAKISPFSASCSVELPHTLNAKKPDREMQSGLFAYPRSESLVAGAGAGQEALGKRGRDVRGSAEDVEFGAVAGVDGV